MGNNFISVYKALPALNCLIECKYDNDNISKTRLVVDANSQMLLYVGLNGASLRLPTYITHWRYVIDNEEERYREAKDWLENPYGVELLHEE